MKILPCVKFAPGVTFAQIKKFLVYFPLPFIYHFFSIPLLNPCLFLIYNFYQAYICFSITVNPYPRSVTFFRFFFINQFFLLYLLLQLYFFLQLINFFQSCSKMTFRAKLSLCIFYPFSLYILVLFNKAEFQKKLECKN